MRGLIQRWYPDSVYYGKVFVGIFLLALVARLIVLVFLLGYGGNEALLLGDSKRYLGLAQSVLETGVYSFANNGNPTAMRPPGYPAYLIIFEAFDIPLWVASLVQLVVSSFIPALVILFGIELGLSKRAIILAGILASIEPVQVFYSVILLADVFSALLLLIGGLTLTRWIKTESYSALMASAVLFGISSYFRPVGIYLGIGYALCLALYLLWKSKLSFRKLANLVAFAGLIWILLIPWQVRNQVVFGTFTFVSLGSYNLYMYGAVFTEAVVRGIPYEEARLALIEEVKPFLPVPEQTRDPRNGDVYKKRSKEIILNNFPSYIQGYILGLNTFLFSGNYHSIFPRYGLMEFPPVRPSFSMILLNDGFEALLKAVALYMKTAYGIWALGGKIFWLGITTTAFAGMWILRKKPFTLISGILVLYFCATLLMTTMGVEARHRFALNPILFVYFFATIGTLYEWHVRRRLSS